MTTVDPNEPVNKVNLRLRIDAEWARLWALIDRLSAEQLTVPTDAAGWTAKDHLIHLSVWEDGLNALLNRQSFIGAMQVSFGSFVEATTDEVNADIQQRNCDRSLDEVLSALRQSHARLLCSIDALSDDDLMLPATRFEALPTRMHPLIATIAGNSFGHYAEHLPWIEAIVAPRN